MACSAKIWVIYIFTLGHSLAASALSQKQVECRDFYPPRYTGKLENKDIDEASGLIASRSHQNLFWTHNDSGDISRIFAITQSGEHVAELRIKNAFFRDLEDIATSHAGREKKTYLYLADIGDNHKIRSTVSIYRLLEPAMVAGKKRVLKVSAEKMTYKYEDGPQNAETLLIEQKSGDLLVVSKSKKGESKVYSLGAFKANGFKTAKIIGNLPQLSYATGGDISPDGRLVVIKNLEKALLWQKRAEESVIDSLKRKACLAPIAKEYQGEAIAFALDSKGYFTVSEGVGSPISFVGQKRKGPK